MGTSTCSHITSFAYSDEPFDGDRTDVVGRSCGTDAKIEVEFVAYTEQPFLAAGAGFEPAAFGL
jgi:hypothetical protein